MDKSKYEPCELYFDIDADEEDSPGGIVVYIAHNSHEHVDLGMHNVNGLPEYFGKEAADCLWVITSESAKNIMKDMISAGFTYRQLLFPVGYRAHR